VLRWALTTIASAPGGVGPAPPPARGLTDLADRAEYHRVTPIVHAVADRIDDLEPPVAAALASSYHHAVRQHLFARDDLAWVVDALDPLDTDVLAIKGPVLAAAIYDQSDRRSYSDLDVVVPPEHFHRAANLLLAAGARVAEPDWASVVDRRLGEVAFVLPSGTQLDLHWHLVPIGLMRDRFSISMPERFARARVVDIDGRRYRTLGPADTAVHLALHAVLCGGDRLGWLEDLRHALSPATGDRIEPAELVEVARSWGADAALAVQLSRAARLYRTPRLRIAADAARSLPSARVVDALTSVADRAQPLEASNGERTVPVALAWAAAPSVRATGAELTRMGARWARRRREPGSPGHRRPGAPDAPGAPPSPADWAAYLDAVALPRA
jgi:hypothetical protein